MLVLPGDNPGKVAKRVAVFVVGWGGLLWGGYHRGLLHGVGDGVLSLVVVTRRRVATDNLRISA